MVAWFRRHVPRQPKDRKYAPCVGCGVPTIHWFDLPGILKDHCNDCVRTQRLLERCRAVLAECYKDGPLELPFV